MKNKKAKQMVCDVIKNTPFDHTKPYTYVAFAFNYANLGLKSIKANEVAK